MFGLGLNMVSNRTSKIRTKWFRFQTLSEIRTVWEWNNVGKQPNSECSDFKQLLYVICIQGMTKFGMTEIETVMKLLYGTDVGPKQKLRQNPIKTKLHFQRQICDFKRSYV